MVKMNLKIYKGFDRANPSERNFPPTVTFHGQIPLILKFVTLIELKSLTLRL